MNVDSNPAIQRALLEWYRVNKRDLPWRRLQNDPYAVWISEIMLQQTTVSAVIPFYERWMERFPRVDDVANASVDEVLRFWSGLGYYSRAHNIKKTADIVAREHGGRFPSDWNTLLDMPGIGTYTAGAIAAIAFQHDRPAIDVNVTRVLTRLAMLESSDATDGNSHASLVRSFAHRLLPAGQSRDFNQAMMELGALICTAREPKCGQCPVGLWCRAAENGVQNSYPPLPRRAAWKSERHVAAAVERGGKLLIVQRPPGSVWAGLWELPRVIARAEETIESAAKRAVFENAGLEIEFGSVFGMVKHVVMHVKIALTGVRGELNGGVSTQASGAKTEWVDPGELGKYAFSSPQKKLIRFLGDVHAQ